jgi:hypothetical protein
VEESSSTAVDVTGIAHDIFSNPFFFLHRPSTAKAVDSSLLLFLVCNHRNAHGFFPLKAAAVA